jgi:hypothetical protein
VRQWRRLRTLLFGSEHDLHDALELSSMCSGRTHSARFRRTKRSPQLDQPRTCPGYGHRRDPRATARENKRDLAEAPDSILTKAQWHFYDLPTRAMMIALGLQQDNGSQWAAIPAVERAERPRVGASDSKTNVWRESSVVPWGFHEARLTVSNKFKLRCNILF